MNNPSDPKFVERRKHPRYRGEYVEYAILGEFDTLSALKYTPSFLRNFSLGGASLMVYQEIAESAVIYLRLYYEESPKPVEVMSVLVWSKEAEGPKFGRKKYNIGVRFVNLDETNKVNLQKMNTYFRTMETTPYDVLKLIGTDTKKKK